MFEFESKMHFYEDKINEALKEGIGNSLSTVFLDLLTNICNFECTFCDAKQFFNVKDNSFSNERLEKMVEELISLKVDSVLLVGEGGEPIIHPYFNTFSRKLLDANIKLGIYTNGSIPKKSIIKTLDRFDFVRISLNAGTQDTHKKIHRYRGNIMFDNVLKFIKSVSSANQNSVGVSFVILKENIHEIYEAAKLTKENGANYIEFKPAYLSDYSIDKELYKNNLLKLRKQIDKAKKLEDSNFKVILNNQLKFIDNKDFSLKIEEMTLLKTSRKCITSKLRMVVSPTGCYLCTPHRSKKEYSFGNPKNDSLVDIWNSLKHSSLLQKECNLKCAYHEQNQKLLELKEKNEKFISKIENSLIQDSFL